MKIDQENMANNKRFISMKTLKKNHLFKISL